MQENVWGSNLIPDIAGVDYFAGHQGRTNLQPLDGLPVFVDDFYVYGPLRENEIVRVHGRKPACTTGENGSGKRVVSQISLFVRQVWGCEDGFKNVATVHANSRSSRIVATVKKIEKETDYRARRRWNELYPQQKPAAYFVAKVDVSELPIKKLQKGLPAMRRLLMSAGCGLYQIDYTQDFSGTLVRPALVQHLESVHEFFQQNGFAFFENGGCILDNTKSVGDHVCTFVQTRNARTASTKFYNKVVCQFEAGDVREPFGGHLTHYIDSTNRHLRRTMLHPDVQRRGCTRVEILLYACDTEDLSQTVTEKLIAEALEPVNTEEGLFVAQSPAKQWESLAQHLDRCMLLGHHPQGAIYLAWSGHSKTNRVQGMLVKPTAAFISLSSTTLFLPVCVTRKPKTLKIFPACSEIFFVSSKSAPSTASLVSLFSSQSARISWAAASRRSISLRLFSAFSLTIAAILSIFSSHSNLSLAFISSCKRANRFLVDRVET